MPTYGYACTSCGHRFERRQSINDAPLTECPECAGTVRRLLFPVGIVFKGSGFYVTDNRKPGPVGPSEPAAAADSGEKKSESKAETKAEAPGAKAETKTESSKESVGAASGK